MYIIYIKEYNIYIYEFMDLYIYSLNLLFSRMNSTSSLCLSSPCHNFCGPALHILQHVHVFLVLGSLELEPAIQTCFSASSQIILVPGVILPSVQGFTFPFVELHEFPVGWLTSLSRPFWTVAQQPGVLAFSSSVSLLRMHSVSSSRSLIKIKDYM